MASKSLNNQKKVMDVSKPGAGSISSTSKPVIVGHDKAKDNTIKEDVPVDMPSATRKVIKPISEDVVPEVSKIEVISDQPTEEIAVIANAEDEPAEQTQETTISLDAPIDEAPETTDSPEPSYLGAETSTPEDTPTEDPTEAPVNDYVDEISNKPASSPSETSPDSKEPAAPAEASDAAGVDELAKKAEEKKLAAKRAEEDALRNSELDDLAASKKYYVKTSHGHDIGYSPSSKKLLLILGVLLLIITGAYLLIDAKVVDNSIKLPYEFFKDEVAQDSSANQSEKTADSNTEATKPKTNDGANQTSSATPEQRGADDERKTEIKNLQQKLEAYFVNFGEYPVSLTELTPGPSEDELTDESGEEYTYRASADKISYILTTKLNNPEDPDLNENGEYVVISVNQ